MPREMSVNNVLCACVVMLASVRTTATIENKASDSENNIGQFLGQLTSLLNQGSLLPGGSGYPGVSGYQSGGYPGPYPPPRPGEPFPRPPGPGVPYPPPGRPYPPPPPGRPYPPPPPGLDGPHPPPYQQYPSGYPGQGLGAPPSSLVGALSSIARYDDLRCVPRLLCEVASGARPGSYYGGYPSYQEPSPLPFLSKDALVTLLTVLNFVDDSPLLVFGRAALLGYTARGDPRACLVAYPTCPRDPDRLVDYLNNHNGGFFRFFNQQLPQYAPQYQQYQPQPYPPPPPAYPQRPYPPAPPQRPYPYPPRPGFPQQYSSQNQRYQSRIQTKPENILEYNYYTALSTPSPLEDNNQLALSSYKYHHQDQDFYPNKPSRSKLVFPKSEEQQSHYVPQSSRGGKGLFFPSSLTREQSSPVAMVFPDRTGTGDLRLDLDEHGNFKSVYYESLQHRDQRQVAFPRPQSMTFPQK